MRRAACAHSPSVRRANFPHHWGLNWALSHHNPGSRSQQETPDSFLCPSSAPSQSCLQRLSLMMSKTWVTGLVQTRGTAGRPPLLFTGPCLLGALPIFLGSSLRLVGRGHALGAEGRGWHLGRECRHLAHLISPGPWFQPHPPRRPQRSSSSLSLLCAADT